MKTIKRISILFAVTVLLLFVTVLGITACGGNSNPVTTIPAALKSFAFNSSPVGLHISKKSSPVASIFSPFVVNAQAVTPTVGNLPGFCDGVTALPPGSSSSTVIFGLGRWTSGNCQDGVTTDSSVGVTIPAAGQIGNFTVDAVGAGGTTTTSGTLEVSVKPAGSTSFSNVVSPCALGTQVGTAGQTLHCEDLQAIHFINVGKGDQVKARFLYAGGDQFSAIRVNIGYASPTF